MIKYQFESLQQLFWMNGHGPYVWAAYGIALVAMLFLVWSPIIRRRSFLKNMQSAAQRETLRQGQAGDPQSRREIE